MTTTTPSRFHLGQCVATPAALDAIEDAGQAPVEFISRHAQCDWGDVCESDAALNDESIREGSRVISAYNTTKGVKLWVITEGEDDDGNREATTILLPEEY